MFLRGRPRSSRTIGVPRLIAIAAVTLWLPACLKPAPYRCESDEDCGATAEGCDASGRCGAGDPPSDPVDAATPGATNQLCVPGAAPATPDACALAVCAADPACCAASWDQRCVIGAEVACRLPCSEVAALGGGLLAAAGTLAGDQFTPQRTWPHGGEVRRVAWGELDGDGRPELAMAVEGSPGLRVYRGTDAIADMDFIEIGGDPIGPMWKVEWRDFDRDGDTDLLASGDAGIVLVEATRDGALVAHALLAGDARAIWTDADGAPPWDLVAFHDATLVHHRVSGPPFALDPVTAANRLTTEPGTPVPSSTDLAWCDVTGDGRRELLAASYFGVLQFRARPAGGFAAGEPLQIRGIELACGDLDGDGANDLVVGGGGEPITVVHNATGVTGGASFTYDGGDASDLDLGDLDHDGDLDVAVSVMSRNQPLERDPLRVLVNQGGPGPAWFTPTIGPDWNGPERFSMAIDLGPLPHAR